MSVYSDLRKEIETIEVVDTHEHLEAERFRVNNRIDMFTVFFKLYALCDLVSAGMPESCVETIKDVHVDIDEKWRIVQPFWELTKNTAYSRVVSVAARDLYGIEDINDKTYRELNQQIQNNNKPGLYEEILRNKCRIRSSILDMLGEPHGVEVDVHDTYVDRLTRFESVDSAFFLSAIRFDDFVWIVNDRFIKRIQQYRNKEIGSLKDWEDLLAVEMRSYKDKGIVAIKTGLAYDRILRYEETSRETAERVFSRVLGAKSDFSTAEVKPLQDYMMHKVLDNAAQLQLPVQVHAGLQEGNGNVISNSNPVHLTNLFLKYPTIKFDVFHGGYPYGPELAVIAKNFQNVYVDMCWLHMISPEYSVKYLVELLDTVPANKILGFGGDNVSVEPVYGHLKMARHNVASALTHKVANGTLRIADATKIARMLFDENPARLFGLR